jgi:hypothetical protein
VSAAAPRALAARWRAGNLWLQDGVLAVAFTAVAFAPPLSANGVALGELADHPLGVAGSLLATIMFAARSVWRALRPGGWTATVGSALLALSIVGLGDLLTPTERLACRLADPGCTTAKQIANTGGMLDNTLSTYGVVALVAAGLFLSFAMRRLTTWRGWAWPTRWTMVLLFLAAFADAIGQHYGLGGLFERLIALVGAIWIGSLAVAILRRNRRARTEEVPAGR